MTLNSVLYPLFFVIVLIAYYLIPNDKRYIFLFCVSLCFYFTWDYRFCFALFAVSALTYVSALLLDSEKTGEQVRKVIFIVSLSLVVGSLLCIRFLPTKYIIIPIGYSFYTLQALGYLIDVYTGKIKAEKNFFLYFVFVSFFPTVIAGPIQRANGLLVKFHNMPDFDYHSVRKGLWMIAFGFFAKNFVADRLGYLVNQSFDGYRTVSGASLLLGTVEYAFQLYCDFLGYSYIAIGSALALGFKLDDNFRRPYLSTSVKEFWGRWHVSLSTWLRDYVYFPLGGSKNGRARTLINLFLVFLISGIWHGRGLTFIVWGVLHALYRMIESLLPKRNKSNKFLKAMLCIGTFILVDFAWLFFRADSLGQAINIIKKIIIDNRLIETIKSGEYAFGLAKKEIALWGLGLFTILGVGILQEKGISVSEWFSKRKPLTRWAVYFIYIALMIFQTVYYYGIADAKFIYAGF